MLRTREEIIEALNTQVKALRSSSASFDKGEDWEAIRLSAHVYCLVHDGGKKNKSVLTQLGVRGKVRFLSSGKISRDNLLSEMPLVKIHMRQDESTVDVKYLPMLDGARALGTYVQFHHWREDPIYRDQKGRILSRKNLVHSLRDQEGGGHFDARLTNEAYIGVAKEGSAGWLLYQEGADPRWIDPGPHFAMMRQIAWELDVSLISFVQENPGIF